MTDSRNGQSSIGAKEMNFSPHPEPPRGNRISRLDNVRDLNVRSKIRELEVTLKILSCQLDVEIEINLIFIVFFYPM